MAIREPEAGNSESDPNNRDSLFGATRTLRPQVQILGWICSKNVLGGRCEDPSKVGCGDSNYTEHAFIMNESENRSKSWARSQFYLLFSVQGLRTKLVVVLEP